jgi:hypothetical protein
MMKFRYLIGVAAIMIFVCQACNDRVFTGEVDCLQCDPKKPVEYSLFVYLTFNDSIKEIPLVLYKGDFENRDTVYTDTARAEDDFPFLFHEMIKVDKEYSMTAEYRFSGRTLYTVDGTKLTTTLVTESCDDYCYVVNNNSMDLEIKDEFLESQREK